VNTYAWFTKLEVVVDASAGKDTVSLRDEMSIDVLTTLDLPPAIPGHTIEDTSTISLCRKGSIEDGARHF
jgi:hypothetical protein